MVNSSVDEADRKKYETEEEQNSTSIHENNLTAPKEKSFEEESVKHTTIPEIKDEASYNNNVKLFKVPEDTVIHIKLNETCSRPRHIDRLKTIPWVFNFRRMFTKYLWKQSYERRLLKQEKHQWYFRQGYLQTKQQVLLQHEHFQPKEMPDFGAGYDHRSPNKLEYDPRTRNYFVFVVMILVLIMLLVTTIFIAIVLSIPELKVFFVKAGLFILVPSMLGLLISNYAMMCSPCARAPPCSYFLLVITCISMTFLAAQVSSYYRTQIVLQAAVITTSIVAVCIILSCTSFDFTKWTLFLVVIGTAVSLMSIGIVVLMKFTSFYIKPLHLGILFVSVLVQSIVFVIELQMVLGGKTIELAEDDYALASFMLYTSIVDVFIKVVQILGLMEDV